ncbi:MAG: thiamine-phosphate kinase [Myxococcota bacterium]
MQRLEDLGELALIERIERLSRRQGRKQVVLGIGDDAAVLRPRAGEDLVVTTDALFEGVHFRFDTQAATTIGRRALAVNLSDLAAMGARPLACTLALAAPASLPVTRFDDLLRGLLAMGRRFDCPLVGGNLTRARETSLTLSVMGAVERGQALSRSAARAGDAIFVTGTLGAAALALARSERTGWRLRSVPTPRLAAGRALRRLRQRGACIDLSDGLLCDLAQVLRASQLGAEIEEARLPRPRGFAAACARLDLDPADLLASGGEDYELLFTLRRSPGSLAALSRRLGVHVSRIGRVTRQPEIRGLNAHQGWRHF